VPNNTAGTALFDDIHSRKFTQEFRLSTHLGPKVDWLLGAFYTHEHNPWVESLVATAPSTGARLALWGTFDWVVNYAEYAAFTDLTVHFTDRFDVQFGVRESHNSQAYHEVDSGPFELAVGQPTPTVVFPQVNTSANPFTYLLTPRFKVSPELMVYARLASGYRPGGPNGAVLAGKNVPLFFGPDKTQNYEVGTKAELLDHRLSIDASVYYIDWKDIQIVLTDPSTGYVFNQNGSRAKSQGIELTVEARPVKGLKIVTWVALNDARLTQDFASGATTVGRDGDRLPFSSRFSGNLSVGDEFPLTAGLTGFVGGSISYFSNREDNFPGTPPFGAPIPPRVQLGPYAKTNLHAGVTFGSWTGRLYVNNVTDRRAPLISGLALGVLGDTETSFTDIQPREIGFSLSKTF
jgi:iron complex outermembrane receptor protein